MQEPSALDDSRHALPPAGIDAITDSEADWDAAMRCIERDDWDGRPPVAFSPLALAQIRLPISRGGFGIQSMARVSSAAFLARTAGVLAPMLRSLPESMRLALCPSLHALPVMKELRDACGDLIARGVTAERLQELLPAGWSEFIDSGSCTEMLDAMQVPPPANAAADAALPGVDRLQSALTGCLNELDAAELLAMPAASQEPLARRRFHLARLRSAQGPGAMACLSAPPSNSPAFTMGSGATRETLRRLAGIERQQEDGGFCSCGKQQSGEHARRCANTGEQNYRHNFVLRRLVERIRVDLSVPVAVESIDCFAAQALAAHRERIRASNGREPRMDAVLSPNSMVPMPRQRDIDGKLITFSSPDQLTAAMRKGAGIDVSIVDPTCGSMLAESSETAGHAAAQRVRAKFTHYLIQTGLFDSASYTIFPFVVEQFGRSSLHAQDFIVAAAQFHADRSGGSLTKSHCVQRLRQVVSIALQTAISDSVARLWNRMHTRPGGPVPDLLAYSRLRLLLRAVPAAAVPALAASGTVAVDAGVHIAGVATSGTSAHTSHGQAPH